MRQHAWEAAPASQMLTSWLTWVNSSPLPRFRRTNVGSRGDAAQESRGSARLDQYPTDHVVAVLDSTERARAAWTVLTHSGFLESEVLVSNGKAAAEALDATTGRAGLTGLAIRIVERFGVQDDEMVLKDRAHRPLSRRYAVPPAPGAKTCETNASGRVRRDSRRDDW